jgi:hypothetical protein
MACRFATTITARKMAVVSVTAHRKRMQQFNKHGSKDKETETANTSNDVHDADTYKMSWRKQYFERRFSPND